MNKFDEVFPELGVEMIYPDKTVFTSDPFSIELCPRAEVMVTVFGPGPVAIEVLQDDDVWRQFPELTFKGSTAQILTLFPGEYRVVITGGPTTVEVRR